MLRGQRRHTEIKASRRGREDFRLGQKIGGGRVLGLGLVLVTARRRGRPIGRRRAGIRRVLVVPRRVTAVATCQLQRLALDIVLEGAVLLVDPVPLHLARHVVVLHPHREIGGRSVVVVERRRQHPRLLRRLIVGIGRPSLVPAYLRSAQQLLHGGRCRGDRRRWRATPGKTLLQFLVERKVIPAGGQRAHVGQL